MRNSLFFLFFLLTNFTPSQYCSSLTQFLQMIFILYTKTKDPGALASVSVMI